MASQDPTADIRKYPKGPNFGLIVALSCVAIVVVFVAAYLFLRRDAAKVMPHPPSPTPNSLSRPLFPAPPQASLV